jgi:hypothetical protein
LFQSGDGVGDDVHTPAEISGSLPWVGLSNRVVSGPAGPLVRIWAAECDSPADFSSIASVNPGIGFARAGGTTTVHLRGPETKASTSALLRRAGRGMAPLDQVAVPAQKHVRAYQQQELAQLPHREAVEQPSEHHAIGLGERGLADLALQDDELVAQRQDLDVLLLIAHGQQAHERERVRQGEVGQAQQHDRS